uniref:Uncharacterized protein n=1 Tax=Pseudomonas phage HRDY3 TaxID=3236930 RepID=A0AB39CEA1_9VIRU
MRIATIIKALGSDKLALYKGSGYFYFTYDDPARNIYETHSVDAVCRLTDLSLDQWISEGKTLLTKIAELEA